MTRPDGAFVLVGGASILLEREEPARVCVTPVRDPRAAVLHRTEAPELSLFDDRRWPLLTGDFVARVRDGTLTAIAFVDRYRAEGPGEG